MRAVEAGLLPAQALKAHQQSVHAFAEAVPTGREQQEQQRTFEYQVNQFTQHIETALPAAIKTVGLQNSPFEREQIVTVWRNALDRGQNPTMEAVAAHVKQKLEEAKMIGTQPTPQAQPQRPKATRQSVGIKNAEPTEAYTGFSEWRQNRGR
jgi:hypothetical protein